MNISGKRGIAIAGAAALIIGGTAALSDMDVENDSMQINVATSSYSTTAATFASVTTTTVKAEMQPIEIYQPEATSRSSAVTSNTEASTAAATSTVTTPVSTSEDTPTEQYDNATIVYVSSTGKYHTRADCSGMKNSTAMDISLAQNEGNIPCSRCCDHISEAETSTQQAVVTQPSVSDYSVVVYVSATGKYHSRPDCSGMKKYTEMERDEAKAAGHEACKKCW